MANVGRGSSGSTLIGQGNSAGPKFASIGTNSGLSTHGVLLAQGNSPFVSVIPAATGTVLMSNGPGADPTFQAGGSIIATTFTTDSGSATPSSGIINDLGSGSITTSASGNTITNQLTGLTDHAVLVGAGTSTITKLAVGTDGQLLTGSTTADPVFATPSSTGGNFILGAGTLKYIPANYTPGSSNIGIAYSGGTFTVQGYDGTALSATNPGYVTLQSKATPGRFVTIAVTANQTFTDGSGGTLDNARFGVTTAVNWANDMPFFLYGVMDDTEALINFMISRNPCATTSPASTSISKTGAIINVNQADFFSLGSITVTSYDSNPCICLGSFRMQFAGATDSYTVQALNTNDGINNFNDDIYFTFPVNQNGAGTNAYNLANGGVDPVFTTSGMVYNLQRDGNVIYHFNGQNASTAGTTGAAYLPVLPLAVSSQAQNTNNFGYFLNGATGVLTFCTINFLSSTYSASSVGAVSGFGPPKTSIQLTDSFQAKIIYKAFTNLGL